MTENKEKSEGIFKGITDRYNGILISSDIEQCNREEFPQKLQGI